MAFRISADCVLCWSCLEVCLAGAIGIRDEDLVLAIEPSQCTECVDIAEGPRCVAVCPIDGIVPDPAWRERREALSANGRRLAPLAA